MEKKLNENEIIINDITYTIKPVKIKYMKNGFYSNYAAIAKIGVAKIFNFTDAEEIIKGLLRGSLDLQEINEELYDNLDTVAIQKLLEIIKRLNCIEDEEEIKNEETVEMKKE